MTKPYIYKITLMLTLTMAISALSGVAHAKLGDESTTQARMRQALANMRNRMALLRTKLQRKPGAYAHDPLLHNGQLSEMRRPQFGTVLNRQLQKLQLNRVSAPMRARWATARSDLSVARVALDNNFGRMKAHFPIATVRLDANRLKAMSRAQGEKIVVMLKNVRAQLTGDRMFAPAQ